MSRKAVAVGSELLLHEGLADRVPLDLEEGVGHPAADDHGGDAGEEGLQDRDLGGDLGPADDGDERLCGILEDAAEELDLLLHQEAGDARQDLGHPLRGGVRAVRGAEGVVDVDVAQGRELRGELGIVLLLLRVEADVFQEHDVAGLHRLHRRPPPRGRRSPARGSTFLPEQLGQALAPRARGCSPCPASWAGRGGS